MASSPLAAQIVINEVDYDQSGTDAAEFLELKNTGAVPENLDLYTVELVNGTGGGASVYNTIDLPNVNLGPGDYYVICANAATVANCDLDDSPNTNFIQNGAPDNEDRNVLRGPKARRLESQRRTSFRNFIADDEVHLNHADEAGSPSHKERAHIRFLPATDQNRIDLKRPDRQERQRRRGPADELGSHRSQSCCEDDKCIPAFGGFIRRDQPSRAVVDDDRSKALHVEDSGATNVHL